MPKQVDKTEPTSKIPDADEWQDFISRVILKTLTKAYVEWMLGDCNLSEHERESISLSTDDLLEMSSPFASYATKNKWTRKHGREIIAATDSIEAVLSMAIWARRVQRIAKRHDPERQHAKAQRQAEKHIQKQEHSHSPAQPRRQRQKPVPEQEPVPPTTQPYNAAFVPNQGATLQEQILLQRMHANGSSGTDSEQGTIKPRLPPGPVANNGAG